MSEDSFTEVTTQSWGSRIAASIKGVVFGVILFAASFVILFWNEGRAVDSMKNLQQGREEAVSAAADKVDPANEGKLVHVTGTLATAEKLADPEFGIVATNMLRLVRDVEMYQWDQKSSSRSKKKLGGGKETTTTYRYEKTWSADLIDSSGFKKAEGHENPASMPFRGRTASAQDVTLGTFKLSGSLLGKAGAAKPLPVDKDVAAKLTDELSKKLGKPVTLAEPNVLYVGTSPAAPKVGDVRIRFEAAPVGVVSVLAAQLGSTFAAYMTETGQICMLSNGTHTIEGMIAAGEARNRLLTWGLRFGGLVAMLIGLSLIFAPLVVVADFVPFVGDLLGAGAFVMALVVSLALSLVTISIAWLFYRPLIGIGLIVVGVGVFVGIRHLLRSRKKAKAAVAA